jgi:phenylalanyl-tRNA synthetase alpha chain
MARALPGPQGPGDRGDEGSECAAARGAAFAARQDALKAAKLAAELEQGAIDITLPGRAPVLGHLHLTTQVLRQLYAIFGEMGFQVYDGPDVETDDYNFGLLNIPPYHPARDMWDTFWVTQQAGEQAEAAPSPERSLVLRTHTSPGQIHAMREYCPDPIRVVLPGKCYRYEQISARSEQQFYQMEGLVVGKGIRMSDLIGTLYEFARQMYGAQGRMRVCGSYFPFTEPSIEAYMECMLCAGKGCPICKHTGWLEVAGAGMVHPAVLRNGGYDPDVYSGFAFGFGVERPALLKYGINDIRYFYGNDLRFLRQFS